MSAVLVVFEMVEFDFDLAVRQALFSYNCFRKTL